MGVWVILTPALAPCLMYICRLCHIERKIRREKKRGNNFKIPNHQPEPLPMVGYWQPEGKDIVNAIKCFLKREKLGI